jgi:AraC-like DNA-binding protein
MEPFDPVIRLVWEGTWQPGRIELRRRIYDCELVYLSGGIFDLILDDEVFTMRPGMIAIIPPAYWHESCVREPNEVTRHIVHFDWTRDRATPPAPLQAREGDLFRDECVFQVPAWLRGHLPIVLSSAASRPVVPLLDETFLRLRASDPLGHLLLWPVLKHIVNERLPGRNVVAEERSARTARHAYELKQYLDTHYDQPIGYWDLQRITGLSKSHLCTAFRKAMGCPPMEYLQGVRLAHAKKLLSTRPEKTVSEIAYQVGFASPNYFARVFRARLGVAPTAYGGKAAGTPLE